MNKVPSAILLLMGLGNGKIKVFLINLCQYLFYMKKFLFFIHLITSVVSLKSSNRREQLS